MRVCSTSLALALLAFHAAEAVVLQPRVRAPLFPSPHALRCLSSSVRLAAEPSETEAAAGDGAVPDGEGMSDAKAEKAAKKAEKDALRAQIDELEKKLTSARGDFVAAQDEAKDAGENGYLLLAANFERERQRARTELDGQAGYGRLEAMRPLLPFVEQFAALQAEADGADGGAAEVHKYYSGIHKQLTQAMGEPRRPPLCLCSLTARTPPLQVLEAAQLEPFDSAPGDARHREVERRPSEEVAKNCVLEQTARGYTMGGELLREAEVVVSSGSAAAAAAAEAEAAAAAADAAAAVEAAAAADGEEAGEAGPEAGPEGSE
ncbi:hypothetical protein EMIHUDRAFT_462701 [Emiliania huxleyi CCMP1516]|uniref:GrpE protein homolog n=2 Tax=Emiliania huxleyi TaxID=2903 RepID=A0A0D3K8H7_EMIH1|nr:hypothetical protein EMIHUDRAFT_462701 [Emiliania huxleyi CCMP1516]EOD32062.1 hypothetical protein EMIHUDRAFT_462701 [Emiliania huxleyi CCMP1516]|eukprot:XP_005784491.1 hypothetical protein EMIHUDRAFT_462701 [Emiliania huxleyi CCMP1516]